jgi:hypothetical protein
MNKQEILDRLISGVGIIDPRIGTIIRDIESVVHRDADPTNDVEEISSAVTELAVTAIAVTQDYSGHEVVNNPALVQLAANIKGDIALYIHLVKQLKPARAAVPAPPPR